MRKQNASRKSCRENNVPVWCGGMLESGIGRAHNIAMATLAGFTLPGDVSASSRYWTEDIIDPPVTVTARGTIIPPEKPGLGFEVNMARIDSLTVRKEKLVRREFRLRTPILATPTDQQMASETSSPSIQQVQERFQEKQAEIISLTRALVETESPSGDESGSRAVVDLLAVCGSGSQMRDSYSTS